MSFGKDRDKYNESSTDLVNTIKILDTRVYICDIFPIFCDEEKIYTPVEVLSVFFCKQNVTVFFNGCNRINIEKTCEGKGGKCTISFIIFYNLNMQLKSLEHSIVAKRNLINFIC